MSLILFLYVATVFALRCEHGYSITKADPMVWEHGFPGPAR